MRLIRDERGQDMIEYALLVGFVIGLFVGIPILLNALASFWNSTVASTLSRISPSPCAVPETYWADFAHSEIRQLPPADGSACR